MKQFSSLYLSALSGSPISIEGVGYIRQPQLKEIIGSLNNVGIGYEKYVMLLNHLSLERRDILNIISKDTSMDSETKELNEFLQKQDSIWDIYMGILDFRKLLLEALGFWVVGNLEIETETNSIVIKSRKDELIGAITKSNYGAVSHMIRQINNLEPITKPQLFFKTEKARLLYEQSLEGQKKMNASKVPDGTRDIDNIISVVCSLSTNYNFSNIGELSVFQLHETFERLVIDKEFAISSLRWAAWGQEPLDTTVWRMRIDE